MSIPEEHQVSEYANATYSRPRFKLRYYDQSINSSAVKTFQTRHEAIGVLAELRNSGRCEHPRVQPRITYESSY